MANTQKDFNPAYSTIKAIYLANVGGLNEEEQSDGNIPPERLNILRQNTECVFERLEFVENINDVLPNGVLVVKDTKDLITRLRDFNINKIQIEFLDSTKWNLEITSASYINNAASDTEENFVAIYFTNEYYVKFQESSLNELLGLKKPKVELIHDFIDNVRKNVFGVLSGQIDDTSNYVLYRPMNDTEYRLEGLSDNPILYLNYLASCAVDTKNNNPHFFFWTEFDGSVNFKYFHNDLTQDPSYQRIDQDYRLFGVYDGDSVLQKMSVSRNDSKYFRKCYFLNTNPAYQYISKNYYYIRKTPKVLDVLTPGLTGEAAFKEIYSSLNYQFQDEGQKYYIELINHDNTGIALPGSKQLTYDKSWGYYDGLESINGTSELTHMGQKFGTDKLYGQLNLMGSTGFMPYVDDVEMWKNMFDLTPLHPNYSGYSITPGFTSGNNTKLQKIIDIRYDNFTNTIGITGDTYLQKIREIELQNFIMYSLCCMGSGDHCFFAILTQFEEDNETKKNLSAYGQKYRYQWNKINFDSPYGPTGPMGVSGFTGATYYIHELEKWNLDSLRSSTLQDDSWAINLNERGLSGDYLPAGWILPPPAGFKMRPIGVKTPVFGVSGSIHHVVRLCRTPIDELMVQSNNKVHPNYLGKYLYYFEAENAFDGIC